MYMITLFFVVLAGLGVFGLNYWHSTRCHEAHSQSEIDLMFNSLQKRVLQAESEALASTLELEKFLAAMGEQLATVEDNELRKLKNRVREHSPEYSVSASGVHAGSEDKTEDGAESRTEGGIMSRFYGDNADALAKAQIALASQPSPLRHKFRLDSKYYHADTLADKIADTLEAVTADDGVYEVHHSDSGAKYAGVHEDDILGVSSSSGRGRGRDRGRGRSSRESKDRGEDLADTEFLYDVTAKAAAGDGQGDAASESDELQRQQKKKREALQDDDFLYIPGPEQKRANNIGQPKRSSSSSSSLGGADGSYSKVSARRPSLGAMGDDAAAAGNSFKSSSEELADAGDVDSGIAATSKKMCRQWQDTHDVRVGVSWGSLPYDLQERWLKLKCDSLLLR
jgi:hypothetical protein